MDFGQALAELKNGKQVTRTGWNGRGQFLELQSPDESSKMTLPYIYITTVAGDRVPWLASQSDLLAADWELTAVSQFCDALAEALSAIFWPFG